MKKFKLPKIDEIPMDHPQHTEILGYRLNTKTGKYLWAELDWKNWRLDGPEPHIFNAGGNYLHVRVKHDPKQDGPDKDSYRQYRVRCWWAGKKYKGRRVTDVRINMVNGRLHWVVSTESK